MIRYFTTRDVEGNLYNMTPKQFLEFIHTPLQKYTEERNSAIQLWYDGAKIIPYRGYFRSDEILLKLNKISCKVGYDEFEFFKNMLKGVVDKYDATKKLFTTVGKEACDAIVLYNKLSRVSDVLTGENIYGNSASNIWLIEYDYETQYTSANNWEMMYVCKFTFLIVIPFRMYFSRIRGFGSSFSKVTEVTSFRFSEEECNYCVDFLRRKSSCLEDADKFEIVEKKFGQILPDELPLLRFLFYNTSLSSILPELRLMDIQIERAETLDRHTAVYIRVPYRYCNDFKRRW